LTVGAHKQILRPKSIKAKKTPLITNELQTGESFAVIADRPDIADKALGLIKAEFARPQAGLDDKSIFDHLVAAKVETKVMAEKGSLAEGEKLGEIFEQTYRHSYGAHAHMETHSTLVKIEGGKATVWTSTQRPFGARDAVAKALGFTPQNVRVITPYVGGGFGGKNYPQDAVEAARLAKLVGKPLQLVWNRSEDFMYDRFRPAGVVKIRSAMTKQGQLVSWDLAVYAAGDWGSPTFYDVPNNRTVAAPISGLAWQRGDNAGGVHPFNVGAWRMPCMNTISFARESHMDIMASKAGIDPVEFRLKHLSDQRMRGVLEAAAKQFGWKPGKTPSGRGVGVSCGLAYGTYVSSMAQIEVDPGTVVNPEGARQQVEGCITMGLGYALSEEVLFKDGEVLARNFDTYEIPRFSTMPKMEVVLVDNRQFPPDGMGEPPIITMGSVIANAIHDATGARLLQLPMTPDRVKAALQRS
jgi:isoquinoline 1-oxidoreductase